MLRFYFILLFFFASFINICAAAIELEATFTTVPSSTRITIETPPLNCMTFTGLKVLNPDVKALNDFVKWAEPFCPRWKTLVVASDVPDAIYTSEIHAAITPILPYLEVLAIEGYEISASAMQQIGKGATNLRLLSLKGSKFGPIGFCVLSRNLRDIERVVAELDSVGDYSLGENGIQFLARKPSFRSITADLSPVFASDYPEALPLLRRY